MKYLLDSVLTADDINIIIYNKDKETLEDPFDVSYEVRLVSDGSEIIAKTTATNPSTGKYYAPIDLTSVSFDSGEYYVTFYITEADTFDEKEHSKVYFTVVQNDEEIKEELKTDVTFDYVTIDEMKEYFELTIYEKNFQKMTDKNIIGYTKFSERLFNGLPINYPEYSFTATTKKAMLKEYFDDEDNTEFQELLKESIYLNVLYLFENYDRISDRNNLSVEGVTSSNDNELSENYGNVESWSLYLGTESRDILNEYLPLSNTNATFI